MTLNDFKTLYRAKVKGKLIVQAEKGGYSMQLKTETSEIHYFLYTALRNPTESLIMKSVDSFRKVAKDAGFVDWEFVVI